MGAFAIVSVCFQCFLFLIIICGLTLWIWMLIDVIRRKDGQFPQPQNKDQKLIWLLIVILTSYIGAAIYYFMVYRKAGKAL
jgi:prolipoprotein diacylglyceryltransferase